MKKKLKTLNIHIFIMTCALLLNACSTAHKAIANRNLSSNTRMSNSIFLEVTDQNKAKNSLRVALYVKNASGVNQIALKEKIKQRLKQSNIEFTDKVDEADYKLQANIIQFGKNEPKSAQKALRTGFGAGIEGAWIAKNVTSSIKRKEPESIAKMVGSAANTTLDALVQDNFYSVIVDVQVAERIHGIDEAKVKFHSVLQQGKSAKRTIQYKTSTNWQEYQTRIVSSAHQINLPFRKAKEVLENNIANSIHGIICET